MLDTDTKRRIDTCRDILVGKVPDPKSQVEQITIALIYKFMDDMDAEAEELGGRRSFFTGEFAKYGWSRLMAPGLGGFEVLTLYAEAIQRMNENPGIPALFRDIFRNAFLPYRDPETLRIFLKEINTFTYDHSERLGDAFEYLLSVLGSQGDAGQFRTPRHIIDFMVEIIDPKKDETILDLACGTAGFLISSYKHILKHNSQGYREQQDRKAYDEKGIPMTEIPLDNPLRYSGDRLTPDDRRRLAANISGYDISPDMVRLSLVNLYLHGFTDPHIEEYDTLTSEEKWTELADVILANPPFMSPKGGIKPHTRFSVQSKRSEVLFVDYIAEHLTPNGRAAVVVPEGIIFQSQTAYRDLRKMLVKSYLVAVISLPAGVFNPYSGVKTSILVMDKRLAKQRDEVLFVKIENDGFNLGAQRRPIDKNDLPEAVRIVKAFLQRGEVAERGNVLAVSRERIGESGEWNLSGDRYGRQEVVSSAWPMIPLGQLVKFLSGGTPSKENQDYWSGSIPWASPKDMKSDFLVDTEDHVTEAAIESSATSLVDAGTLLCVVRSGILKHSLPIAITMKPMCFNQDIKAFVSISNRLITEYLFWMLKGNASEILEKGIKPGVTVQSFHSNFFNDYRVPLPPLEVQKEIVAEIEGYQKIIDGARQVVENYQPRIPIRPDWPIVDLETVIDGKPKNGYSGKPVDRVTDLKVLSLSATTSGSLNLSKIKYLDEAIPEDAPCRCRQGDIYLQRGNTAELVGTAALFDVDEPNYIYPDLMIRVRADESKILTRYLLTVLQSAPVRDYMKRSASGAAGSMPKINQGIVERTPVPLPSLETQHAIVTELEAEQRLVDANKDLIRRFEEKIKQTIDRVWGESA
ncbi:N-6 DNA methylase [Thiocystis violacea]|uniref:N-6 DNA methylase n=1 Tax=Thiocystis violacea TaxID=13725 RepID=UPI001905C7B3|nr:N-6 DNA methylase [Thiocystis violacea]MBK1720305.1 hypothetical protein [Thiocystis violacea]